MAVRNIKLVTTEDGSHSLYNKEMKEGYHSFHGALQESRHVFIQAGLQSFLEKNSTNKINILEVGLGTGLNALLVAEWAIVNQVKVKMTSYETHPVGKEVSGQLNYPQLIEADSAQNWFDRIHGCEWGEFAKVNECFELKKVEQKIQEAQLENDIQVIFFDAFAPNKQEDMWGKDVLEKVTQAMSSPGHFVTYSAKGQLKRDLKDLGLEVETLAGPPGKKEMVRGLKLN